MALDDFRRAFPPDLGEAHPLSGREFAEEVRRELGVIVPPLLETVWNEVGCGYLGGRALYLFGTRAIPGERALVDWNRQPLWREIFPSPSEGGPVFFAENPFGEQIGFRMEEDLTLAVLFIVDTFESFVLAETFDRLFEEVLNDRDGITDPDRLRRVVDRLGALPRGRHFAPIVSPLVGGSDDADNFEVEDPLVHFRTALATHQALAGKRG